MMDGAIFIHLEAEATGLTEHDTISYRFSDLKWKNVGKKPVKGEWIVVLQ
jgi:hypothetical protein